VTVPFKRRMFGPSHDLGPTVGLDVQILKRGIHRTEDGRLPRPKTGFTKDFGRELEKAVGDFQIDIGHKRTEWVDRETWEYLWMNYLHAYDKWQYTHWNVPPPPPPPVPPLVYPLPLAGGGYTCQGIHYTAGLPGNVAVDFCADPNTPILCVEAGVVQKLSGHSPADDTWDSKGIFGWSTYIRTENGYVYFYTHQGRRAVSTVGMHVKTGQVVGYVGDQHYRPDHVHVGVTSPLGISDATKRILAVSVAPRVKPVL
jgi:Peptidase family M23